MVIAFMSSKGGVGKSTLSLLYALFLGNKSQVQNQKEGVDDYCVELIDGDINQKSMNVINRYTIDDFTTRGIEPTFTYKLRDDIVSLEDIVRHLHDSKENSDMNKHHIILDTIGASSDASIIYFLRYVDYLVIPIRFSKVDFEAVLDFVSKIINKFQVPIGKIMFIPNRVKVTSRNEFRDIVKGFCVDYGIPLLPDVTDSVSFERLNTCFADKIVTEYTNPTFEAVDKKIGIFQD